eukprot:gene56918-biopygen42225
MAFINDYIGWRVKSADSVSLFAGNVVTEQDSESAMQKLSGQPQSIAIAGPAPGDKLVPASITIDKSHSNHSSQLEDHNRIICRLCRGRTAWRGLAYLPAEVVEMHKKYEEGDRLTWLQPSSVALVAESARKFVASGPRGGSLTVVDNVYEDTKTGIVEVRLVVDTVAAHGIAADFVKEVLRDARESDVKPEAGS